MMKKILIIAAAILFPLLVLVVYYGIFGQTAAGGWSVGEPCGIKSSIGLECPGCGGQRAVHLLLHGDILAAIRHNLFFVVAMPFLAVFYVRFVQVYLLKMERYQNSFVFKPLFGYMLVITVVLFTILRNIPYVPFIYLAPPV